MKKKIIVIGNGDKNKIDGIKETLKDTHDVITVVDRDGLFQESYDGDIPILNTYEKLPEVYIPFYPKAKHSPKGHQRKYKFHK